MYTFKAVHVSWAYPASWTGSPRWEDFNIYKNCIFILFLSVAMLIFVVVMLKSNLERIAKQNMHAD